MNRASFDQSSRVCSPTVKRRAASQPDLEPSSAVAVTDHQYARPAASAVPQSINVDRAASTIPCRRPCLRRCWLRRAASWRRPAGRSAASRCARPPPAPTKTAGALTRGRPPPTAAGCEINPTIAHEGGANQHEVVGSIARAVYQYHGASRFGEGASRAGSNLSVACPFGRRRSAARAATSDRRRPAQP